MQVTTSYAAGRSRASSSAGDFQVLHFLPRFEQMELRDFERLLGEIDAGDFRASRSHRFGEYAAAATDVEDASCRASSRCGRCGRAAAG